MCIGRKLEGQQRCQFLIREIGIPNCSLMLYPIPTPTPWAQGFSHVRRAAAGPSCGRRVAIEPSGRESTATPTVQGVGKTGLRGGFSPTATFSKLSQINSQRKGGGEAAGSGQSLRTPSLSDTVLDRSFLPWWCCLRRTELLAIPGDTEHGSELKLPPRK